MSQEKQLNIKVKNEDLKGKYSNMMQVLHTKEEFILDFFFVSPPMGGVLASRIVMSPSHFKRMIKALHENIKKYEKSFNEIEEAKTPESNIGFNA